MLTVTSLLTIILLTIHVVDDIVRGFDNAGIVNMFGIVVLAGLLYGTTLLRERLAGRIMALILGFFQRQCLLSICAARA